MLDGNICIIIYYLNATTYHIRLHTFLCFGFVFVHLMMAIKMAEQCSVAKSNITLLCSMVIYVYIILKCNNITG